MDEQLKSKLLTYLDFLEAKVQSGDEFVVAEAPLVIQEWLLWTAIENWFLFALSVATVAASCWGLRQFALAFEEAEARGDEKDQNGASFTCLLLIVAACLGVWFAQSHLRAAVKVHVAPRVVVIEKVSQLIGVARYRR